MGKVLVMVKIISRDYYIKKISPFIGKNLIKVIIGQRRVGKSYFLLQLVNLFKEDNDVNIIYINKESVKFKEIKNYIDLLQYIEKNVIMNKDNKIFIDEIQDINDFEKALRSLQADEEYDIYCSGSNADLLSGELATFLSGRYIEITIYPLSYNEFLHFFDLSDNNETYNKYIKYGGHPYLIHLELTDEVVFDYINNIYSTILLKDIVTRYSVRNIYFLENLVSFIADNIGSLVSAKKISDYLKSQDIKISTNVVLNYLTFLTNAFLVNRVKRENVEGKKIFEIGEKYYFNDIGLRNSISGYKVQDKAKILENVVYNHLISHGYKVTVGKLKDREIDFICKKNNEETYIQVAYKLDDESTINREYGNLLRIKNNYPKIVVSTDDFEGNTFKGITHFNIRKFLSEFE